jgi:flagellar basal-body rod modification protein FlgD
MTVDFNTIKGLGLSSPQATRESGKNQLKQDDFMTLLITQLKHQDPLKPQDSAEFLSQMAQFSTVNGLQELQKTVTGLAESTRTQQSITAGSLVGRSALVASGQAWLPPGGAVRGELVLPQSATGVTLEISDARGKAIKTLELGEQAAGTAPFTWNGQLEDGQTPANPGLYRIKATGSVGGQSTALETRVASTVDSVSLQGLRGLQVNLAGLGSHSLQDMHALL